MTRTERLEVALREALKELEGCPLDHDLCEQSVITARWRLEERCRAALADTAPSCCEETRGATLGDIKNLQLALNGQPVAYAFSEPGMREHDAEVRRAALEEAAKYVELEWEFDRPASGVRTPNGERARRVAAGIRALSNQAPPKSHVVHRVIEEGLAPACKTEGATRTTTDEAEVTCRRCLVLFGWIPPSRRDEHALDEARTAQAGQCSCSVATCVHQKIREAFDAPPKSQAESGAHESGPLVRISMGRRKTREEVAFEYEDAPPVCPTCHRGRDHIGGRFGPPCPDCAGGGR